MVEPATFGRDFQLSIDDGTGRFVPIGDVVNQPVPRRLAEFVEAVHGPLEWWQHQAIEQIEAIEALPPDMRDRVLLIPAGCTMSSEAIRYLAGAEARSIVVDDPDLAMPPILPDFELCKQPANQPTELAPNRKSRRADAAKQRRSRR